MTKDYIFISKSLFFPKQGILAIGDLHIGYEAMLRQSGVLVPSRQVKDIINEIREIFLEIKKRGYDLGKIVFLGDIKHAFGFEKAEKNEFQEVIEFLGNYLPQENIILIKGNHDTIDYTFEGLMKPYYIDNGILFLHGHRKLKQMENRDVNTIVFGHIHPCVLFEEAAKKEAYKCFLTGNYLEKEVIVMPSFLGFVEGTPINDYEENYVEDFSIVPKKDIMNFQIHAIGEKEVLDFGKVNKFQYRR
ncbi:metallophosphoesterase [Candidatus Pacearchaeota archaeon]|nr:metallophosphoesterase [Candidatus Pacearchaeota archaeon]